MGSIILSGAGPEILDIQRSNITSSILEDVKTKLRPAKGMEKQLPTMLLYDEKGLKYFEHITYLDEYYLTNNEIEIEILNRYADTLAARIANGAQLIELGSGNLRKISILLKAIDRSGKDVDYYALDLSLSELDRTLSAVPPGTFRHVKCRGLLGTYDDGLEWLKLPCNRSKAKVVMSLGSSVGNFDPRECATFLHTIANSLQPCDALLIGVDSCLDRDKVYHAYNDKDGLTHEFYRNGLDHANKLLGFELFKQQDWDIVGEFDEQHERHQAFALPKKDIDVQDFRFKAGERVRLENSYKFSSRRKSLLWNESGLDLRASYVLGNSSQYSLDMLSPSVMSFSLDPAVYAASPVPSLEEFQELWKTWDLVSQQMLPHEELLSKPIHLRNCCLFYLGHIPAFFDIHLTRATHSQPTEPASFHNMFERGIDPDVDNPELCHAHSEIPKAWPPVKEILAYQERVRQRTILLYESGRVSKDRTLGKAMWLGFEHEAMHIETFLYMLLQSDKTLPPPGVRPDFEALAHKATSLSSPNQWVNVPRRGITVGLNEWSEYWGWDNEIPVQSTAVHAFEAKSRPLTNGDYASYLVESNRKTFPKSWIVESPASTEQANDSRTALLNGYSGFVDQHFVKDKTIRTVYGPVPLIQALDWPVMGSYDELASCADWLGGRLPTAEEAHSIYDYAEEVNGKDDPALLDGASPVQLHSDLRNCNVSFKAFHPMPVTLQEGKIAGRSGMGGAWEWTSSVLAKRDGFEAMHEYPAYTADFFDGKHNIMLGGSWATHSRIAGRKSFVNWYQRNYPYVWAGARMVRDVQQQNGVH